MKWPSIDWRGLFRRAPEHESPESTDELSLLHDERGATYLEYVTIIILVGIASIAAYSLWQQAVKRDAQEQYQTFGTPPTP